MTEDRDFKDLVRARAAKTGESYQAARRQLEADGAASSFSARVEAMFRTPSGLAFGCVVEQGTIARGMHVNVVGDGVAHHGSVTSLRRWSWDVETVSVGDDGHGQFGLIVDPPYDGPLPERVTG